MKSSELEKEAQRIINRFYRIESGYQWCEAKAEALICVDEILCALYENVDCTLPNSIKHYLSIKKMIERF